MGEKAAEVALLGSDLLMASRLQAALAPLGVSLTTAAREEGLPDAPRIFVDLNQDVAERIAAIARIRRRQLRSQVIGFCDHDEKEVRRQAIAAGATEVVANRHLARAAVRLAAPLARGALSTDLPASLDAQLARVSEAVVRTRRDLHRHPELAHQETRTAGVVADHCRDAGYTVRTGVGGTGVLAELSGGGAGPTVLYRADMDGLPIEERRDGRPVRSEAPGVMHACGHDGHVAIALGVAGVMAGLRASWRGRLRLCFQPAEEVATGALPMIEAGALEGVDQALGIHLWTGLDTGRVAITAGPIFGSADEFRILVRGRGGHGGLPHLSVDPVLAASHVVVALQSLTAREVAPDAPAVVTVGLIRGGQAFNVIAEEVELRGTVRAPDEAVRRHLLSRVEEVAAAVAGGLRAEATYELIAGCPPVINAAEIAESVRRAAVTVVGEERVDLAHPLTIGDDMAYFLERVPGCYFLVGAGDPASAERPPHHHPAFDIDEGCLDVGVAVVSRVLLAALQ
jgi:amidohydrolase